MSVYPFICQYNLSIRLSIRSYMSVRLAVSLSVRLFICLSVCLPIHLYNGILIDLSVLEQVAWNKSSLLLKIILQNSQTLQLFANYLNRNGI